MVRKTPRSDGRPWVMVKHTGSCTYFVLVIIAGNKKGGEEGWMYTPLKGLECSHVLIFFSCLSINLQQKDKLFFLITNCFPSSWDLSNSSKD